MKEVKPSWYLRTPAVWLGLAAILPNIRVDKIMKMKLLRIWITYFVLWKIF